MQRTEKIIEINAPVERVFDLFSDFESFPRWMSHIKEVRYTGRRYTRWKAEAPLGSSVEWEAETTAFEPDRRISWRSVRGDVETEGEVVFQETGHGTTLMRVRLGYDPPAGRLGAALARLFGTNPEEQLEEDLERFAAVAEGPRRGRHKEAQRNFYVEERYRSGAAREANASAYRSDERALRPDARRNSRAGGGGGKHDRRERERDYETRRGYEEYPPTFEHARPNSFDRGLSESPGSQRESMRRYDEERRLDEQRDYRRGYERDEHRFARDERRRRGPADERRSYEGRMRHHTPQRGEDDRRQSPPSRHALTPRERELERARRRPDSDYPRKAFGRGVDKLLDEEDAPSKRWRR